MYRNTARFLAVFLGVLGLVGLFNDDHLFGIINVDMAIDVIRIVLAIALAVVGFGRTSVGTTRAVLAVSGIVLVLVGGLGLVDNELFGLAPSGFTGFDIACPLILGLIALIVAAKSRREDLHTNDSVDHSNTNVNTHTN